MRSEKLVLKFPSRVAREPIVYHLVKDFNLKISILRASISADDGQMVLEIEGGKKQVEEGHKYLERVGVSFEPLSKDVHWREDRCAHCTACIAACPTGALNLDRRAMRVAFNERKCIACELCIPVCMYKAMEIRF